MILYLWSFVKIHLGKEEIYASFGYKWCSLYNVRTHKVAPNFRSFLIQTTYQPSSESIKIEDVKISRRSWKNYQTLKSMPKIAIKTRSISSYVSLWWDSLQSWNRSWLNGDRRRSCSPYYWSRNKILCCKIHARKIVRIHMVYNSTLESWITVFTGYVHIISYDQIPQLSPEYFHFVCCQNGIISKGTPTQSHNSLGLCERFHSIIKRVYNKLKKEYPNQNKHLRLLLAFNTVNNTTGH